MVALVVPEVRQRGDAPSLLPSAWPSSQPSFWSTTLPCVPSVWTQPKTWGGSVVGVWSSTLAFIPSACSKYFVPHLQVFGSVSIRPKNLEEAGSVFGGGQTLGTYSKRLLKPCLLCQVFGDGQTLGGQAHSKNLVSNLQVFGRGPATLPCTPSIWRWPNVLAVTSKVAGSGAGPNMTCGPLFQALAPNAWFPFVAAKLRQVFGHKQKLGKTRSIVGRATTWAFMPSACSKNLGFQSPSFWEETAARQVFGDDGQTSWQGRLSC